VAWNDKVLLYQWAGPNVGIEEYQCDSDLKVVGNRALPGTKKDNLFDNPYVVTRPGAGADQLLLMLIAPGTLTFLAPESGQTGKVNVPIDGDPTNTCYSVMSNPEGLVVVGTPITGHSGVSVFACTWRELDAGAPMTRTTLLPPEPLRNREFFQNQRAVCFHDGEGPRLLVSLLRTLYDQHNNVKARTTMTLDARLGGMPDPIWTSMGTETAIYDLHLTPDLHPVALGQVSGSAGSGVKMWVWAAPGAWDDLGDPTDGELAEMSAASSVYVPGPGSPPKYDRVLIIQPTRAKPVYWTYRSPYSRTPTR
jgi:hypothetical protein